MFLYVFPHFFNDRHRPSQGIAAELRTMFDGRDTRGDLLENSQISYSYHISFFVSYYSNGTTSVDIINIIVILILYSIE